MRGEFILWSNPTARTLRVRVRVRIRVRVMVRVRVRVRVRVMVMVMVISCPFSGAPPRDFSPNLHPGPNSNHNPNPNLHPDPNPNPNLVVLLSVQWSSPSSGNHFLLYQCYYYYYYACLMNIHLDLFTYKYIISALIRRHSRHSRQRSTMRESCPVPLGSLDHYHEAVLSSTMRGSCPVP